MNLKIILHKAEGPEHSIPVFEAVLESTFPPLLSGKDRGGEWSETFGSLGELNAFLTGVRACYNMLLISPEWESPKGDVSRLLMVPYAISPLPSGWDLHNVPRQVWPEFELADR